MTRDDVKKVVFDAIEDAGWNYSPILGTLVQSSGEFNENTNLTYDLEMDSLDITDVMTTSCQNLGIDIGTIYESKLSSIYTVKDIVDSIWGDVNKK